METERSKVSGCVKRVYSSLWSPKVSPVATYGERLDCALPP